MIITCPKCETRLNLPDGKLKPGGTRFKCSKCGTSNVYRIEPSEPLSEKPLELKLVEPLTADQSETPPLPDVSAPPGEISKQPFPLIIGGRVISRKAALAGAGGLLVIVLGSVLFFSSADKGQGPVPWTAGSPVTPQPQVPGPAVQGTSAAPAETPAPQPGEATAQPEANAPAVMSGERAIEMVKRSEALLKMTTVESIVKKWTEENSGKYKMVGWQARKMDDQKYLVSYIAMDGDRPKGFYFDLDVQTGVVQDLARNPELQKKYNIQYSN